MGCLGGSGTGQGTDACHLPGRAQYLQPFGAGMEG